MNVTSRFLIPLLLIGSVSAWAGPVNINTADAATIAKELKGIGPAKARAIVEHRQQHGAFRSLDELAPQTRRLLLTLDGMVAEACAKERLRRQDFLFSRRQVREHTGWSNTQVHVHLERLVDLEYVIAHRAARGHGFSYELVYDGSGKDGQPFLSGLLDVEALALEDRLDELVEAARDDHEAPAAPGRERDELMEARPKLDVLELPADDLLERPPDRLELPRDHLAEAQPALTQAVVDLLVDERVAEAARDRVEQVDLRDGAVEVDDDRTAAQKWLVTPAGSSSAVFAAFAASGASNQEYA